MMKKRNFLILVSTIFFLSCGVIGGNKAKHSLTGEGNFIYTGYQPLADKPIRVWYYVPENKPDAEVLILMHGNSRNAEGYWKSMKQQAERHQFLLIVPEFSKEHFPSSRDYHQGGMFTRGGKQRPREVWAFSVIEPLFDDIKKRTGNRSKEYALYGFSAGSQFVHRFLMFSPDNRVSRAIAAAAGTYTMPEESIAYSYGLKNTHIRTKDIHNVLQKDLTILVGEADTVLSRSDLVKTPAANRQGRDRVARGQEFYRQAKELAKRESLPFNWKFGLVPHAGHTQSQLAEPVANILFGNKD